MTDNGAGGCTLFLVYSHTVITHTEGGCVKLCYIDTAHGAFLHGSLTEIVCTVIKIGDDTSEKLVEEIPAKLKEGISKEDAEAVKAQLEAVGATIEIK